MNGGQCFVQTRKARGVAAYGQWMTV